MQQPENPLHKRITEVIRHLEQIPGFPTFEPTSSAVLARDTLAAALPIVQVHETGEPTPDLPLGYQIERVRDGYGWVCGDRSGWGSAWTLDDAIDDAVRDQAEHPRPNSGASAARSGLVIDAAAAADFVPVVESSPGLTREGEEHLADVLQDAADSIHELLQPGERGAVDDIVFEPEEARVHVGLLHRAAGALRARPTPGCLPASTRTEIRGTAGDGMVVITTSSTGEIAQVTCHDVGPEPEEDDEDTLAERCKVTSGNLTTLLGSIGGGGVGGENVPEPLWSGVVTASVLLAEVAEVLRSTGIQLAGPFWTVTVGDDPENSEDMYEIAIPASPEVDAAMVKWAQSFDEICAVEEGRELHEQPVGPRLGAHDSLIFRQRIARADLDEDAQILNAEGVKMLLDAVATLQDGESLSLAGGHLATTLADLDDREPRYFGDLWSRSDAVDARGMRGDHHHPDDMAVGDEDPTPEDLADQAFARETDPPNLPQTLAANYVRQGWMLHQAIDRSVVHLIDAEIGTLACEPSATVSGMHIDPDGDLGALKLCGRCCAAANDRASQP